MPPNNTLDYSQYKRWQHCEMDWYEHYVSCTDPTPREGYQDTALSLGSLVHKGLENFRSGNFPYLSEAEMTKLGCSPEFLGQAQLLLAGYIERYPDEDFTTYHLEEPLRFPLTPTVDGLAKIDNYFTITEPVQIEDGLGDTFTLNPGTWIHEYKTKSPQLSLPNYLLSWKVNMQAAFQLLALSANVGTPVAGVLVNILEKPGEYIPKHTCKGCRAVVERASWSPTGEGYACPLCGNIQKLDLSNKSRKERKPNYYRHMVTRTEEELGIARREMEQIADEMEMLRIGAHPLRATERCVHPQYGACQYFSAHSNSLPAKGQEGFVQIDPFAYIGEKL